MALLTKRLRALETVLASQLNRQTEILQHILTDRFSGYDLLAVAAALRYAGGGGDDPAVAAYGARLLAAWKSELGADRWAALWPYDAGQLLDRAMAVLPALPPTPTQL